MSDAHARRASFTGMETCTGEDWAVISSHFPSFAQGLPDRILAHLRLLDGDYGGFAVDRLTHSLQTATLAQRAGCDEEYVVRAAPRHR
jgi:predicted HD phosphohydrolase